MKKKKCFFFYFVGMERFMLPAGEVANDSLFSIAVRGTIIC
jgi:hypothetical protein